MAHTLLTIEVAADWVDYNGHMNDAEYARVFSLAVEALSDAIGLDVAGRTAHRVTLFTLETHICYLAEALKADPLRVEVDILDRDAKRLHVFFTLFKADQVIAVSEQMLMTMTLDAPGGATVFPAAVSARVDAMGQLERTAWPAQSGRQIGIRRKA